MLSRTIFARRALKPIVAARGFAVADNDVYLITGAGGQIGKKITEVLAKEMGPERLIGTDMAETKPAEVAECTYHQLDIRDKAKFTELVKKHKVTKIVHLAAIISALGEKEGNFEMAYTVNVDGSYNVFNLAREFGCSVFLPTSIAVFGGTAYQKDNAPVDSILQPETIYGASKAFNENLGAYYHKKFGVDFRCLRYPGVVSSTKFAFNGTVSYPTEIFFEGLSKGHYECYLQPETQIPVIYIDDCIKATLDLIQAPRENLKRCVYNLAGMAMTPQIFEKEVKKLMPGLTTSTKEDPLRQAIGESWPNSLDESTSAEWGWKYNQTPEQLARQILVNIDDQYKVGKTLNL